MDISNFIPEYPSIETESFSYEIAKKKEFQDLKMGPGEVIPEKGSGIPLLNQELQRRFFSPESPYTRGLINFQQGVGKSCTISFIIENFKNSYVDGKKRPRALLIVPNETIRNSIEKDISNVCTRGVYLPKKSRIELRKEEIGEDVIMTERLKELRIRRAIRESYEMIPLQKFSGRLKSHPVQMAKKYSNRIIAIDEAHNLRIKSTGKDVEGGIDRDTYLRFHRFLHDVENTRQFLLTGTPILDKTSEIASLMNLILPDSEQLPTGKKFMKNFFKRDGNQLLLTQNGRDRLKDAFTGRVTVLRAMMTDAKKTEVGVTTIGDAVYTEFVKVFPVEMSKLQTKYYNDSEKTQKKKKAGGFHNDTRGASDMIVPIKTSKGNSGYYGSNAIKQGKKSPILKTGTGFKFNDHAEKLLKPADPTADDPHGLRNLAKYSAKFAEIIRIAKDNPDEKIFIYNDSVKGSGGVIALGLVLKLHGFGWAKQIGKASDKKRFTIISGETTNAKQASDLIVSFNKPNNDHGERCQIFIGTKTIALGITLESVSHVIIISPWWNIPFISQAIFRAYRTGSHKRLKEAGEDPEVKVYRMASVKYGQGPNNNPDDVETTTDLWHYQVAEGKEFTNTQIYRVMKECAWDCPLTYGRNVLETDEDGTRFCDYVECNYVCEGYPEELINKDNKVWDYTFDTEDADNYNLFYSEKEYLKIAIDIIELFGSHYSLHFEIIKSYLDFDNDITLLQALNYLIDKRIRIKDRLGFYRYLQEDNNIYYLIDDIGTGSSYAESIYISKPYLSEEISIETIIADSRNLRDIDIIRKFCKELDKDLIHEIHYQNLIKLVEKLYPERNKKGIDKFSTVFLSELRGKIIDLDDGIGLHNFYTSDYTRKDFRSAKTNWNLNSWSKIRIYEPKTGWRFLKDQAEAKKLIPKKGKVSIDVNEDRPYVGLTKKKKFAIKIYNPAKKKQGTGQVCKTTKKNVLIDIFVDIDYYPHADDDGSSSKELRKIIAGAIDGMRNKPEKLTKKIIQNADKEKLLSIRYLLKAGVKVLCDLLEQYFKDNNLFAEEI